MFKKKNNIELENIIIIFLHLTPLIFLLRSAIINIHLTIISILFLIYLYLKNNFSFLLKKNNFLLILFWMILVISTMINDNPYILKSIFYIRFIFFTFAFLYFYNLFFDKKYNYLFVLNLIILFLISADLIYQFINGKNILGYVGQMCHDINNKTFCSRYSGIFGDELIMGGYLSTVGFLIINRFFLNNKVFIIINFVLLLLIILTGERSALLLCFVFNIILFFKNSFEKKKSLLVFTIIFVGTLFSFNNPIKFQIQERFLKSTGYFLFDNFYDKNRNINPNTKFDLDKFKSSPWSLHYHAGFLIFKKNMFFGGGIKSFRLNCKEYVFLNTKKYNACSTHPHNFLLEVLIDTGIIGFFSLISFFILKLKPIFDKKFIQLYPILFLIIIFLFLPRPTGSLFSTFFAFQFWYFLSLLITVFNFKKKINFR